jgi:hypothetical protein
VVTPPLTLKQFGLIYTMIYQLMLSNKGIWQYLFQSFW